MTDSSWENDRSPAAVGASISIVTHPATQLIAEDILVGLGKLGLSARIRSPQMTDSAVVLVLSRTLVEEWTDAEELVSVGGPRPVPVVVETLDGLAVPERLAQLNWIPWNPAERGSTLRLMASACTTELDDFNALQSLTARAEAWDAGGRSAKEVANTPKQLRELQRGAAASGFERLSPHVSDFLAASAHATQLQRRRRRLRIVTWFVLGALLSWGAWNVADTLRYLRRRQPLDLSAAVAIDVAAFSQVRMVQLAALTQLQLNRGEQPSDEVVKQIIQTIAVPSASRRFHTAPSGMFINFVSFGTGGDTLMADGGGGLWKTVGDDPAMRPGGPGLGAQLVSLAATPDLSTWVAATQSRMVISRDGRADEVEISGVEQLTLTPDGRILGALTERGFDVWRLGAGSPTRLRSILAADYFASGVMHGRLVVILRIRDHLRVADAEGGEVLRRLPNNTDAFSKAAIGERGEVVVQGKDSRLWLSTDSTTSASLGVPVQDVVSVLAITSGGQLVYASKGGPTHLMDLRARTQLNDVCTEATARTVTLSPDGRLLACDYGAEKMIWELDPVIAGPVDPVRVPRATDSAAGVLATLKDLSLTVTMPNGTTTVTSRSSAEADRLLSLRGRPTTIALDSKGQSVAVGSDTGDVLVSDITPTGALSAGMRWRSPDGSAVKSLTLSDTEAEISTTTGTWKVSTCVGCTTDMAKLLATVRAHLMPCYTRALTDLVGSDVTQQLGVVTCAEA